MRNDMSVLRNLGNQQLIVSGMTLRHTGGCEAFATYNKQHQSSLMQMLAR